MEEDTVLVCRNAFYLDSLNINDLTLPNTSWLYRNPAYSAEHRLLKNLYFDTIGIKAMWLEGSINQSINQSINKLYLNVKDRLAREKSPLLIWGHSKN